MKDYTPRHRRHGRRTDRERTRRRRERRASLDASGGWRDEYRNQRVPLPDGGTTDTPDDVADDLPKFVPGPGALVKDREADPGHDDTVAAWFQARAEDSAGRAAVADGGGLAALSGAGDPSDTPDADPDDDHDPGTDDRASDAPPDTPDLYDEDGHLVDGHGRRLHKTTEDTARLHHEATAAGWRHSYDLSPYHNLRALVELVEADRRAYGRFAYQFILGYGPGSTPQALDRLGVTP